MGSRADLDVPEKIKLYCPFREPNYDSSIFLPEAYSLYWLSYLGFNVKKEINSNYKEQSPSLVADSRSALCFYFLSGANEQNSKPHALFNLLALRAIRVTSKWSPLINIVMQFGNNFARRFGTPTKLIRPSNLTHASPLLDTQGVCLPAQHMCCFTQRCFF